MINPDRVLKTVAAIEAGDLKTVRLMLKAGVPANHFVSGIFQSDRRSLAHIAANCGQTEIFELLLSEGADINAAEESSYCEPKSMLRSACSGRDSSLEIVRIVLSKGQTSAVELNRSLLQAAYHNDGVVKELLSVGADPNYTDADFNTPLIIAILAGNEAIALELLKAGANATLRIKNKESDFWKKSILEVAEKEGLKEFLAAIETNGTKVPKTIKTEKPKTIEACWQVIDGWLSQNVPGAKLPSGVDFSQSSELHELLKTDGTKQVRDSLACHDGTGDFSLIVMSGDASYHLLSMADSVEAIKMMKEVFESERNLSKSIWWSDSWWPIADNGGGDFLIVECEEGKRVGQVIKFSHETRRTKLYKKSVLAMLQEIAVDLSNGLLSYSGEDGGLI